MPVSAAPAVVALFAAPAGASISLGVEALVPIVGAVFGGGFWFGRIYFRQRAILAERRARHAEEVASVARQDADTYRRKAEVAGKKLTGVEAALADQTRRVHDSERQLQAAVHKSGEIKKAGQHMMRQRDTSRAALDKLQTEYGQLVSASGVNADLLDARTKTLARLERRMRAALKLEGQLWNAKSLQARPKFRDMGRRRRAIVSVLNLKGGVGKTTVTAHLGLALAARGYRVLLVDLDLQGSLTSLLLDQTKIAKADDEKRLLQYFMGRAALNKSAKIEEYATEVCRYPNGGLVDLVGTSDNLAYAELNLSMRWLLGTGERDTRFLLRKALHLMSVTDRYDVVLLDCPPLVNISCVNALAASDYVLIPTTMSRKSRERVPQMLRKVVCSGAFMKYINHDLRVLGVVANRTFRDDLTGAERADWNQLGVWCRDANGGQEVRRFAAVVSDQRREMGESEQEFKLPDPTSRLAQTFAALAAEIEGVLPDECRRPAKTP